MNKRIILALIVLMGLSPKAVGQRIKYKELFVLLSAKQYEEAERYLKIYLKTNDDNPNAYLYMGLIYEDKATRVDILKETERYVSFLDSAVYFFGLASKGMTEKAVSKNEEWYQMYNRRDVRTGEFGVKHSDVILDLETRMKLKDRAKMAVVLKSQFVAAEKAYRKALAVFVDIQNQYPDLKRLYLQADDSLGLRLHQLAAITDSCHMHFNDYKATAKVMGRIGYNQDLNPQDITEFKREVTPADFYADDIKIQDFKRWAYSTADVIEKEMKPLRELLVNRDMELNRLQQVIKKDSVSVRAEALALRAKGFPELVRIDPNPLPLQVFEMKQIELEFGSQVVEDRSLRDTASLVRQVEGLRKEILFARKMDSIAGYLVERNIEEESANYMHFVKTAYGTPSVLRSLIRSTKELALREIIRREAVISKKTEALRWIVDGTDSIPLFAEVSASSRFRPLILQEEKFTSGLTFADSTGMGYFYSITPSRKPAVKATFPVNKDAFKKRYLPVTKAIATQDADGMVYFVLTFQETKLNDKYQATLTKIYKVEGLSWSIDVVFDQLPFEMVFTMETSELSIKTKSSIGEMFVSTFNRDGKPVK